MSCESCQTALKCKRCKGQIIVYRIRHDRNRRGDHRSPVWVYHTNSHWVAKKSRCFTARAIYDRPYIHKPDCSLNYNLNPRFCGGTKPGRADCSPWFSFNSPPFCGLFILYRSSNSTTGIIHSTIPLLIRKTVFFIIFNT